MVIVWPVQDEVIYLTYKRRGLHVSPPGGLCHIQVSRCRKCEPTEPTDSQEKNGPTG